MPPRVTRVTHAQAKVLRKQGESASMRSFIAPYPHLLFYIKVKQQHHTSVLQRGRHRCRSSTGDQAAAEAARKRVDDEALTP